MPVVYVRSGDSRFAADQPDDFGERGGYPAVCGGRWDLCLDHPRTFRRRYAAYRTRFGLGPKAGPRWLFPFAIFLRHYSEGKLLTELTRTVETIREATGQKHVLVALDWIETGDALRAAQRLADRTGAAVVALTGEHWSGELQLRSIVTNVADAVLEVEETTEGDDLSWPFRLAGVRGCPGFFADYAEVDDCVVPRVG